MLRKIIPLILIVVLIAGAAGYYLFSVNSASVETSETTVVTLESGGVVFRDSESNPIPGVMCNVCDETVCTMLTSDENGLIEIPKENFPCEVKFLKVPEGFKLPEKPLQLGEEVQIVDIMLEKA